MPKLESIQGWGSKVVKTILFAEPVKLGIPLWQKVVKSSGAKAA